MNVTFYLLNELAKVPTKTLPGDSGYDLYAAIPEAVTIKPGDRLSIPTGVALELSPGLEAQVRPKSGLAFNQGLVGQFGTIDNGFRGEIQALLVNHSRLTFVIEPGIKVAQLVIQHIPPVLMEVCQGVPTSPSDRGVNGFGSTGAF